MENGQLAGGVALKTVRALMTRESGQRPGVRQAHDREVKLLHAG